MSFKHATLVAALAITGNALAADLKAPFSFPSAKVLPKGVRNLSYKGVYANASEKYNNAGNLVTVADPLNTGVSFQKAIDGKKTAWEKAALEQAMIDLGKNPSDEFGRTTGDVQVAATAHVPVLAFGASSKLTLAVAVPVLESTVHIDRGAVQTNKALYDEMVSKLTAKGVSTKVAEFSDKMADPTGEKAREYGYKDPVNETKTKLGDVKFVAKYALLQQSAHAITGNVDLTAPTGKDQDVNELVDVASGDEQTDLGVGIAYDYSLNENFTISSAASYTWQLADTTSKRIPEVSYSKATPDIDPNTKRDLGDMLLAQLATTYNYKGLNLGAGYSFQYKEADSYSGQAYSAERYGWMGQDTRQNMQAVQLMAGYDTIYLFKKKAFPAPIKILFTHSRVVDGKNVVKDPLYALDLNLFF